MKRNYYLNCTAVTAAFIGLLMSSSSIYIEGAADDAAGLTETVEITKTVECAPNTFAPTGVFTFHIVPDDTIPSYTSNQYDDSTPITQRIYQGIEGGVVKNLSLKCPDGFNSEIRDTDMGNEMIGFGLIKPDDNTGDDKDNKDNEFIVVTPEGNAQQIYTAKTGGSIDRDSFSHAPDGVYRYKVTEVKPTNLSETIDGMEYDPSIVYVDILTKHEGDSFTQQSVAWKYDENKEVVKLSEGASFINTYHTYSVTLHNDVSGNLAEDNRQFNFQFSIKPYQLKKESYYYSIDGGKTCKEFTNKDSVQVKLGNSDEVIIYGLSENDTITAEQLDHDVEGYSSGVDANKGLAGSDSADASKVVYTYFYKDEHIYWTNTRTMTPTGLNIDFLPYAGLAGITLAAGLVVVIKRRSYQ